jgi:hypothetical protein
MNTKTPDLAKMKAKIAMLLAKAERTEFPEERDTFNAAAEQLMVRMGIARAELESVGQTKPEEVVQTTREYRGIFAIAHVTFAHNIALGVGHIEVLQSSWNRGRVRTVYFVGVKSDVADLLQLLDSLEAQVLSGLAAWRTATKEERRYLTAMDKELRDRSFITGFASTVRTRLAETRQSQEQEVAGTGTELVLVGKDARVKEFMTETFGQVRPGRSSRQGHSYAGSTAGREAGRKADIGSKKVSGSRTQIGS